MDCNSITLAGITMDCAPSQGCIKRVWLTQYGVKVTVDESTNMISGLTVPSSNKWYEYQFRKGTGSLTSTLTVDETAGTNYVTNELALVFTKMETAKRIEIAALSVGHLCAVVEDSNGKYWFLGKDDYLSASAGTGVTGTAKGDQNAYTITLSTDSETYPYELSTEAIASLTAV
jgi:hypothetical protein